MHPNNEAPTRAHAFVPPNGASRSPCPCLNTLANHSYLPHNGRNITFHKLASSLREGMGLSPGFALFMAVGTFILLHRPTLAPFDLAGTSRHNFIEHNASMIHADASPGEEYAPCDVDPKLLNEFLAMAHPSESASNGPSPSSPSSGAGEPVITMSDIALGRVRREAVSLPVDALHAELGRAEFAMMMEIFGKGQEKEIDRADLEPFFKENRMPDGWSPSHTLRLWEPVIRSRKIRSAMHDIREKAEREPERAHDLEWFKSVVGNLVGHNSSP